MKRIILNLKLLKRAYITILGAVTAALSFLLLFIEKEAIGINSTCSGVLYAFGALVVPLFFALIYVMFYQKTVIKDDKPMIRVKYGDLWKEAFPRSRQNKEKKIVVINVNTTFDVIVDEDVSRVQKPLVSSTTMHGQLIKKLGSKGIKPEELLKNIKENLEIQGISPVRTVSRPPTTAFPCVSDWYYILLPSRRQVYPSCIE